MSQPADIAQLVARFPEAEEFARACGKEIEETTTRIASESAASGALNNSRRFIVQGKAAQVVVESYLDKLEMVCREHGVARLGGASSVDMDILASRLLAPIRQVAIRAADANVRGAQSRGSLSNLAGVGAKSVQSSTEELLASRTKVLAQSLKDATTQRAHDDARAERERVIHDDTLTTNWWSRLSSAGSFGQVLWAIAVFFAGYVSSSLDLFEGIVRFVGALFN
jgi:hypothetical protein